MNEMARWLSSDLLKGSTDLTPWGVNEIALRRKAAEAAVDELVNKGIAILGGDLGEWAKVRRNRRT